MANKQQKKRHMTVPVSDVIVLPQVRKTFETENIIELANDIAVHGIIQPPIVGVLSKEEMVRHLKLESIINGTNLSIKRFRPGKDGKYYRLIAGERRYRAHMHLLKKGCEKCQLSQRSGQECYLSHFGSITIEVRACVNIGAKDAKSIQFRENNHKRPPLHEEAYAFRETFECFKAEDSSYTLKAFAEFAGVGVDKVGRALAYTHLPDIVREVAETELISFSHAVEFKRFAEVYDEKEYLRLVQSNLEYLMLHPRVKLEDLKEKVNSGLKVGSKIGIDERLNFSDSNDTPVGKAMNEAYARGEYVKFMVEESDDLARETNDESGANYSAKAAQIAKIIQKYIGIAPKWQKLVSDESKEYTDTLERYMGTHASISEAFLAKVIEITEGVEARDSFIEKYPNGFDYLQGFEADIVHDSNGEVSIEIRFDIGGSELTKILSLDDLLEISR